LITYSGTSFNHYMNLLLQCQVLIWKTMEKMIIRSIFITPGVILLIITFKLKYYPLYS
jgi:hypothetical protein